MRKLDVVVVVVVVALGAALLHRSQTPFVTAQSTPTVVAAESMKTQSGRWTVLPNKYSLAGLTIGMSESEVIAAKGEPSDRNQQDAQTATWTYTSDGADLHLAMLEGRLIMIGGIGRWMLTQDSQSLPGFMASKAQIEAQFGPPDRKDEAAPAWVYTHRPGELTFHFQDERVSQVVVTGEIAPQKL